MRSARRRWLPALLAPITAAFVVSLTGVPAVAAAPGPAPAPVPAHAANPAPAPDWQPAGCQTPRVNPAIPVSEHPVTCFALVDKSTATANGLHPHDQQPPAGALSPTDIRGAYRLPAGGGGQTVAVVDAYGYTAAESDLAQYRSYYGLPPCTSANGCFRKTDQSGGTNYPPDSADWGLETALDLDAISAACPDCHILLVEADSPYPTDLGTAVDSAVALGAKFVSNSYGQFDTGQGRLGLDQYYDHPGVAVTVATGDEGGTVNWPASNPDVVAVGGTTLTPDNSARGWHEAAWGAIGQDVGGGSGCAPTEPKPGFQADVNTGCANRAVADVSADAGTGLAVYDTFGNSGWARVGGTSLASPLTAAMYALAGTPQPGTYPVTYPYLARSALNDITDGANSTCGSVLCQAGPGWDGPTGLGTPDGVSAFVLGPRGDIVGTVTNATTGAPVSGATVISADGGTATTGADGGYDLNVPAGAHDLTVSAYAYRTGTAKGVVVADKQRVTENLQLTPVPAATLSGTVTDGGSHHWPLYAKITVDGYPGPAVYSDPFTGQYSITLPQKQKYTLHAAPVYPGYQGEDATVSLGTANKSLDLRPVPSALCTAPGYGIELTGTQTSFTGWKPGKPQGGWTVTDQAGHGEVWSFGSETGTPAPTAGDHDYAYIDAEDFPYGDQLDTALVSPVANLSTVDSPTLSFDTVYQPNGDAVAHADLSLDGGKTWTTIWSPSTDNLTGRVSIPLPQAAHQASAQVRFDYDGDDYIAALAIDNVELGSEGCAVERGGLVAGFVLDHNTGSGVDGATVTEAGTTAGTVSTATPDDPNRGDGLYWLFAGKAGPASFSAAAPRYSTVPTAGSVTANAVTRQDLDLRAGRLTADVTQIGKTATLGRQPQTAKVQLSNTGTEPLRVSLGSQQPAFTPADGRQSVPAAARIAPAVAPSRAAPHGAGRTAKAAGTIRPEPAADPDWAGLPDYPTAVQDNAVTEGDGKVWSVGGFSGSTDSVKGYVFDPSTRTWSPIADAPVAVSQAKAAWLNGVFYLIGGWADATPSAEVYAYHPATNTWREVAHLPLAVSAEGVAVLGGKIYSIGGCTTAVCDPGTTVAAVYDPAANTWSRIADYPVAVDFGACAGVAGQVICAGGENNDQNLASTYRYDPARNAWTQGADLPGGGVWAMSSTGANGRLQLIDGITPDGDITNQVAEYDPVGDTWSNLPPTSQALYRGAAACGIYQVGGDLTDGTAVATNAVLPGYDGCGDEVPWLSESTSQLTLAPGQHTAVTVTLDSSSLPQPGSYTATVLGTTDSPYPATRLPVTLTLTPPSTWGEVSGTVTDAGTGAPLAGATVQIGTLGGTGTAAYTLSTDQNGQYRLWLDRGGNPLQLIAAKDGYAPQAASVNLGKQPVVRDFPLRAT